MLTILHSLFPVFAIISLGYAAKHYQFLEDGFWRDCEKLAYYILLPLLLFTSISSGMYHNITSYLTMILAAMISILVIILLVLCARYLFHITTPDFTSLFQGSIYANAAYIGIPAAYALFGQEGLTTYALLMAAIVPFVNIITIITLSLCAPKQGSLVKVLLKRVGLHPIILSCLFGFGVNILQIPIPLLITDTLKILGNAAIAIGLIIVGGALDIKALRGSVRYILGASFLKLILAPVISLTLAHYMGITGLKASILVLYSSLPTAAATYLLAKKMHGNAPLMAGIIVFETIFAFITMILMTQSTTWLMH